MNDDRPQPSPQVGIILAKFRRAFFGTNPEMPHPASAVFVEFFEAGFQRLSPRARCPLADLGVQSRLCLGRQLDLDIVASSDTESKPQEMDVPRESDGTDFGILTWSTSAVCFGPPWAQQTSTLDLSVSLDSEAGVGLESQGGTIRADSVGV